MILFFAPWFDDHTGELLFTRHVIEYAGSKPGHDVANDVYLAYVVIGQSLMTLMIGFLGGLLGRYYFRRSPVGGK